MITEDDAPVEIVTILDACVVLNLVAGRRVVEIVGASPGPVVVAETVVAEAVYVRRGGSGDEANEREQVDLRPFLDRGSLQVVSANEDELTTFVDLTADLDDGEAMTVALAIHRGYTVASDDRRVARALAGRAPLRSTLDLIRRWAERDRVEAAEVRAVLVDVRERGNYLPSRAHPHRAWWEMSMGLVTGGDS
jgi:predicted nucleic acid-binding protein